MLSIGFRSTPKNIFFTIIEEKENDIEIISVDSLNIPIYLDVPTKLNYIRKTLIDIINKYNIKKAGIKLAESNAKKINIERIYLEAIIQELFSSCTITLLAFLIQRNLIF